VSREAWCWLWACRWTGRWPWARAAASERSLTCIHKARQRLNAIRVQPSAALYLQLQGPRNRESLIQQHPTSASRLPSLTIRVRRQCPKNVEPSVEHNMCMCRWPHELLCRSVRRSNTISTQSNPSSSLTRQHGLSEARWRRGCAVTWNPRDKAFPLLHREITTFRWWPQCPGASPCR
jgi:hypothetical protein